MILGFRMVGLPDAVYRLAQDVKNPNNDKD